MGTDPVRVSEHHKRQLEEYHERHDTETLSDAADEVIAVGLRETRGPLLHQARERVFDAAFYMVLLAAVVAIIGWTTSILTPGRGLSLAATLLTTAIGAIGIVELLRVARGQNDLGDAIGGVL